MALVSVFTWQAAVAIIYTALWNIGLYFFNTRSPLWRNRIHVNLVLMSNTRIDLCCGPPKRWFAWDLTSPRHLVSSPIGVLGLALFRAFEACVFVFTIAYGNVLYEPAGGSFFIYFTNWTFVLFGLTAVLGAALTTKEWMRRRRATIPCACTSKAMTPCCDADSWTLPLQFYHLLLTTTCSASIMLTIFYWFADYMPGEVLRFDNPIKHGASSLLLLLDVALSRVPLVSYHLQVVIAYGSTYLVFLWSYYGGTGTWVYRALDWTNFTAVPYYFALPVLLMLGFTVMFIVASIREFFVRCSARRREQLQNDKNVAHFLSRQYTHPQPRAKSMPSDVAAVKDITPVAVTAVTTHLSMDEVYRRIMA